MTPSQIKYVRGLLARHGLTDQKEEIVMEYTDGRTSSLSAMTYRETKALIAALEGGTKPRDAQVNKILSMAHEMGWELQNGKADLQRIDRWCIKYTDQHKPLSEIEDKDLPKVVTIFQKVYMSFLKGI